MLKWQPTPVLLPGRSCGRWSLVGYSPWGGKESDTTERLHFHFYFNCLQKVYLLLVSERYIALTCWNPSCEWSHPIVFFCLPVEPSSVVLQDHMQCTQPLAPTAGCHRSCLPWPFSPSFHPSLCSLTASTWVLLITGTGFHHSDKTKKPSHNITTVLDLWSKLFPSWVHDSVLNTPSSRS